MLLAHVVSLTESGAKASASYNRAIKAGTEPPLDGVQERVLRLCGRESDTTLLAIERYGEHIWPVYENQSVAAHIVWQLQEQLGSRVPVFWQVMPEHYAERFAWQRLQLDPAVFIRTATGKCSVGRVQQKCCLPNHLPCA